MIIGTCGHELKTIKGNFLALREYDREGNRTVAYICVCNKCKNEYKKGGYMLPNKKEEDKWLNINWRK